MQHTVSKFTLLSLSLGTLLLAGCPSSTPPAVTPTTPTTGTTPTTTTNGASSGEPSGPFSLAWSEYPSWSVFGVADELGLIDKDAGELGTVERKWNVDIELKQAAYLPCLDMYSSATADAVCITNTDVLTPALQRPAVAILPTSTSDGADALLAVGIDDVKDLKGVDVRGAALSVSQYAFERNLEKLGENIADYKFTNMEPDVAATQMASGSEEVKAIMVWNPFVMNVRKELPNVKLLFDSTSLPGEIIDMVVVGRDSLQKPGGGDFACAVIDAFYQVSNRIEDPSTREETLLALGREFAQLGVEDMEVCVEQTKFYKTPEDGIAVFTEDSLDAPMANVLAFCERNKLVDRAPMIQYIYGTAPQSGDLVFDPSYIKTVAERQE